jgi:trimeric autotransporter adhesin
MRRFVTLAVLFLFTIPFGISISGCAKKSSVVYCSGDTGPIVGQATTITLTPKLFGISLNYGQFGQVASPTATDCKGSTVSVTNYTYGIFDANGHATLDVADVVPSGTTAGKLCGGTWNRNTGGGIADYTTCNPTNKTGTVYVVASSGAVSSNPIPIFVHPVVTSVVLGNPTPPANCATDPDPSSNCCPLAQQATVTAPPYQGNSCISQGQTAQLAVRAYANASNTPANNITCSVGHLTYTPQTSSIVTIDENGVATAQQPGSTIITANIANAGSSAGFYSTCPPTKIALTVPGASNPTNVVVNQNFTQALAATATDKNNTVLTGLTLTYQSTQPSIIPAGAGTVTPAFPGAAAITAICQPPSCNPSPLNEIGLFSNGTPVASNSVNVTTPGTSSTLLYIASTHSRYLVPIDFTNPSVGPPSKVQLPYVPNSMIISNDGSTIYLGSSTELMTFNATANSISKEDPSVTGKVLAVSPDGSTLVITDPIRQLIYLYSSAGVITSTYGGVATAAEFTPDSQTVYVTTGTPNANGTVTPGNTLLVHSQFTGWTSISLSAPASDVAITVPSVGAYLAGSPTTARSYCPSTTLNGQTVVSNEYYPLADSASVPTQLVRATNDGLHILGATVSNGPSIVDLAFKGSTPGLPIGACPTTVPPTYFTNQRTAATTVALSGVTATSINDVIPSSDSKIAFVTYNGTGSLPAYTPSNGAVTNVTLQGGATSPIAATISSDNSTLYVGTTGDNKVHLINVKSLTDDPTKTIAPNLPDVNNNTVTPDLIVQHPKKATS